MDRRRLIQSAFAGASVLSFGGISSCQTSGQRDSIRRGDLLNRVASLAVMAPNPITPRPGLSKEGTEGLFMFFWIK